MHAGTSVILSLGFFLCVAAALPTRDQILELYHRAPQHIKDALARHGIHAHNLPSPASLANLHSSSSSLISSHPGLANRLNLHALASRAQAILKRPPSQLPFPIPTFNKNSAQFQRRSGLVLPFAVKNDQKESSQATFSGPAPQIVTVPPMIEGLQQNTHIKPVSSIINFGPVASSSSSSASDGIITGRPMREGQLPVKPQTSSPPSSSPSAAAVAASSPSPASFSTAVAAAAASSPSQNLRKPNRREEHVVTARSFGHSFDSGDTPLSRPFSLPLNVRNPKYEYGGFVPISSSSSSSSSTATKGLGGSRGGVGNASGSSNIITSPLSEKQGVSYANGFMIDEEPIAASSRSRVTGPTVPDAVVRGAATYDLIRKATALVEDCQLKKQDFCIMDDETYPKVEVERLPAECNSIVNAMYVRIPQNLIQSSQRSLCESDRKLKRLAVARDIHGQWAIILQSSKWSQKAHLTVCRDEGRPCQRLGGCSVKTKCVQKFAPQTLVALDSLNPGACPRLRAFNLPSGCECYSAELF